MLYSGSRRGRKKCSKNICEERKVTHISDVSFKSKWFIRKTTSNGCQPDPQALELWSLLLLISFSLHPLFILSCIFFKR